MEELTDNIIQELDNETKIIPFTSDTLGKNVFKKNENLTKQFLKDVLKLDNEIKIMEFLDTELEVEKSTNYKFITDLLILINENILVNIELCRDYYNNHKERLCAHVYKLSSLDIKKGSDLKKDLKNIKQIVFACREKEEIKEHKSFNLCEVETREVLSNNLEINVHYLELHKKIYYNNNEVKKENLWFALFASNSLIEANEILKKISK